MNIWTADLGDERIVCDAQGRSELGIKIQMMELVFCRREMFNYRHSGRFLFELADQYKSRTIVTTFNALDASY